MERPRSGISSAVLYNPYMDRSRASSKASVRDKSVVEKESISDDSEDIPRQREKITMKTRKPQTETMNPPVIKDEKARRPGFFSNMKHLMEMRKAVQANISRGNTPTRAVKIEPSKSKDASMVSVKDPDQKVNTSITGAKISLNEFMDNIATQKKLTNSKLTARKFSSPTTNAVGANSLRASPTGPRLTQSREKPFNAQLMFGFKIDKNELSSMAKDLSCKLS